MTKGKRSGPPGSPPDSGSGDPESTDRLGELAAEGGGRVGASRLLTVAAEAGRLAADLRDLARRARRSSGQGGSPTASSSSERTLLLLDRAADAAEITVATFRAALRAMELAWEPADPKPDQVQEQVPPTSTTPPLGLDSEPDEVTVLLIDLLDAARRALRVEAEVNDMLWRLRILQFSPITDIAEGAPWTLAHLEPVGRAAQRTTLLTGALLEGPDDG